MEEMPTGSNSDAVETTLGGLRNFQNSPPSFASS